MHWRNFYSSGIQGGFVASAVGAALAEKDNGAISCVFMGDGTMGEGAVYEALNFASLLFAPVLFVVDVRHLSSLLHSALTVEVVGNKGRRRLISSN